jgi:lipoprotein-anchoring transpeptidase ErfK/SrfK
MSLTRRDFLKLSTSSLSSMVLLPVTSLDKLGGFHGYVPTGRVTRRGTPIYSDPDYSSLQLEKLERDALLELQEEVDSPYGPAHNPIWYRLEQGFVHSAFIQRIPSVHINRPLRRVAPRGFIGEITVPFTQTIYKNRFGQWLPLYRLYYGSLHWVTAVEETPSGEMLYRLYDDWLRVYYRVPAEHIRPVASSKFRPISADVSPEQKRLEVSIERQRVTAYEGRQVVLDVPVSTGKRWTTTPVGDFQVDRKHPSRHMGDGGLTSNINAYELVGVPWVSFFHSAGIAFHGTFWHSNFGEPMSMGCVNMRTEDACWLFRWTTPYYESQSDEQPTYRIIEKGGTQVVVV